MSNSTSKLSKVNQLPTKSQPLKNIKFLLKALVYEERIVALFVESGVICTIWCKSFKNFDKWSIYKRL